MKLVSFTGAQSTGKTTLLHKLTKRCSLTIEFVPEVTRRIHKNYDLPINEEGGDITQFMIIADHLGNIYRKPSGYRILRVLDRCIVDGFVYTNYLKKTNKNISYQLEDLAEKYMYDLCKKYDAIFYTDPSDVPLVDDGTRSVDIEFRNQIIESFEYYIEELQSEGVNIVRLKGTVDERLQTIYKTFDELGIDKAMYNYYD